MNFLNVPKKKGNFRVMLCDNIVGTGVYISSTYCRSSNKNLSRLMPSQKFL